MDSASRLHIRTWDRASTVSRDRLYSVGLSACKVNACERSSLEIMAKATALASARNTDARIEPFLLFYVIHEVPVSLSDLFER